MRLRPSDAGSHFNLGMALLSGGEPAAAVESLQSAVRFDASQAKHHQALGQALAAVGRKAEAVPALMQAAALTPGDTGLLVSVASLLIDLGELNAAAGAGFLAVQRQPGNAVAQGNLARALQGLGDSGAALAPARAAARLAPLNAGAAATLGAVLYTLGRHAEALERCRYAALLMPSLYQAKMNEALSLEALGQLEAAEAAARAALRLAPEAADVRHNLAAMLLASGRMTEESWALYDARLHLHAASRAIADRPRWQGEDIAGKTVLLHCEQGFGDTIQFLRYARRVSALGAQVILAVQPELLRLLRDLPDVHAVVPATASLPEHDVFCPLLSLPRAFGTTLETVPADPSYIAPDPGLVRRWQAPPTAGLKVGLVWAGSTVFVHDRARSIPPGALTPLSTVPGVTFHSLQKPAASPAAFPMSDRMADVVDFADTAAMIAGLDLVISVDSAVAHLAAAMGKEVWLLSRFVGCWRWLRTRQDSPWYPTMRIFRQSAPGDWDGVIERVRDELTLRTTGQATSRPDEAVGWPAQPNPVLGMATMPANIPRFMVALMG